MTKSERVKLCLSVPWHIPTRKKQKLAQRDESFLDIVNSTRATVMVGDQFYHDIYFPQEELEKSYLTLTNKPVKLNHTDDIEYEIGYGRNPMYGDGKITIQPVIVPETKHSETALGWIKCRSDAGQAPEVSVEVWVNREKEVVGDEEVVVARDLEFDGFALVSRGACSPEAGCGIGMNMELTDTDIYMNGEKWIPLEELDKELEEKWDTTYINNLPNMAFAAVESCASEKKRARHLPHHNNSVKSATENNSVDLPHLRNALARVNQIKAVCKGTDIASLKKKALRHLITHAKALGVGDYETKNDLMEDIKKATKSLKDLEDKTKMTKKKTEEQKLEDEEKDEEETTTEEADELKLSLEKEIEELKTKQNNCAELNKKLVKEKEELSESLKEKLGAIDTLQERIEELEKQVEDLSKPRQKGLNSETTDETDTYQHIRKLMGLGGEN